MPLLLGDVARSRVLTPVGRFVSSLRVRGLAPTLVSVCDALRHSLWLHETHVWSSLDLRTERPHLPLPAPFSWTLGTDDDVPRLGVLGIDVEGARRRRAAGHDVWLIRDGDLLVYAGWVFHRRRRRRRRGPAGSSCCPERRTRRTWSPIPPTGAGASPRPPTH